MTGPDAGPPGADPWRHRLRPDEPPWLKALPIALASAPLPEFGAGQMEVLARSLSWSLWLRDPDTAAHCHRVAQLAVQLCRRLALGADEERTIGLGALLHDIGKIGIPDSILLKPAPLDRREWSEMRAHPIFGLRILESVRGAGAIARLVSSHHERLDGDGYPEGLRGEQLTLGMRIVILTDAVDAMLSRRPYREPLSPREAITELRRNAGSQFDPDLVTLVIGLVEDELPGLARDAG